MFEELQKIYNLIEIDECKWRDELIKFLWSHGDKGKAIYSELINHLIRIVGLYPYIDEEGPICRDDKIIKKFFSVEWEWTLHREQFDVLNKLLNGENILLSAPTSFWKTFVINSFLVIKRPNIVVIIVPTIALMDELRRKISNKFKNEYKIITTVWEKVEDKSILIFPQERAFSYIEQLETIDFLVVDEFYKISKDHDRERFEKLQNIVLKLSKISKQKYFLAPNITTDKLNDNEILKDVNIINKMDFHTVFIETKDFSWLKWNEKNNKLVEIMNTEKWQTILYAGTFSWIEELKNIIINNNLTNTEVDNSKFIKWLKENYCENRSLVDLINHGIWLHTWKIPRSIAQIQINLFEEWKINHIICTSSIIEWVNTSAENVIIWKSRNWQSNIKEFTYKNIKWRWWRMFKHFVWKLFLLDKKEPEDNSSDLSIEFWDSILLENYLVWNNIPNTKEQEIKWQWEELNKLLWEWKSYKYFIDNNDISYCSSKTIKKVLEDMNQENNTWNWRWYLNSQSCDNRYRLLNKIYFLIPWFYNNTIKSEEINTYIKYAQNIRNIPFNQTLKLLNEEWVTIDTVFKIENFISNNLASFLFDVWKLYNYHFDKNISIDSLVNKLSKIFLPANVYNLEEYWLPRVISRKIQNSWLINLEDDSIPTSEIISQFIKLWKDKLLKCHEFDDFDKYIIEYFFNWI